MTSLIILAALALDWLIGDPQSWPHPVRLIGRLISLLEKLARKILTTLGASKIGYQIAGAVMGLLVVTSAGLAAWFFLFLAEKTAAFLWLIVSIYLTFSAVCLKDLLNHARLVEKALSESDIEAARHSLSWIVGRDTGSLDDAAIRRAVVETLAENFSDGLVAPLMYLALGGPVLAWIYKAINTLDSMVGYKNDRYIDLGRFSAKLDDAANYLPARLAALLLVAAAHLCGLQAGQAFRFWRTQGRLHSSPNSGQTEAAMAGALGVFLGGASFYGGAEVIKPVIGQGQKTASATSVKAAMKLVVIGTILAGLLAALLQAIIVFIFQISWGWGLSF
ncbi:MAG: adenosylcobinamide-phosphate synthase CbiB [Deltaproteobacteria bacterium]|jgi:adenosylcobinamide-phosphate synthase|nr:adenosylcobinamide-phosphate synthase CbiB [Deltaproteobacteria bacterium]